MNNNNTTKKKKEKRGCVVTKFLAFCFGCVVHD